MRMSECRCSCASHRQGALLSSSPQKAKREQLYRQDAGQPFNTATDDSLSVQPEKELPRRQQGFDL